MSFLSRSREHLDSLSDLLEIDRDQFHDRNERGWMPLPRKYAETLRQQHDSSSATTDKNENA